MQTPQQQISSNHLIATGKFDEAFTQITDAIGPDAIDHYKPEISRINDTINKIANPKQLTHGEGLQLSCALYNLSCRATRYHKGRVLDLKDMTKALLGKLKDLLTTPEANKC
jgi:hypothetical protein